MLGTAGQLRASYPAAVLWAAWDAVSRWWNGVELWLTQLGFALQVTLLMLVVLPVCWWATRTLDRVVGVVFERFSPHHAMDAAADAEDAQEPR